jgi:hypothetical protein
MNKYVFPLELKNGKSFSYFVHYNTSYFNVIIEYKELQKVNSYADFLILNNISKHCSI